MPVIEVVVSIMQDGVEIFGHPIQRRVAVDEATGTFTTTMAASASYVALPPSVMAEVDMLVIQADKQVTVRLDAQTDKGIILQPEGLLLILDGYIVAGAGTNIKLFNNSVETNVRGVVGGT